MILERKIFVNQDTLIFTAINTFVLNSKNSNSTGFVFPNFQYSYSDSLMVKQILSNQLLQSFFFPKKNHVFFVSMENFSIVCKSNMVLKKCLYEGDILNVLTAFNCLSTGVHFIGIFHKTINQHAL